MWPCLSWENERQAFFIFRSRRDRLLTKTSEGRHVIPVGHRLESLEARVLSSLICKCWSLEAGWEAWRSLARLWVQLFNGDFYSLIFQNAFSKQLSRIRKRLESCLPSWMFRSQNDRAFLTLFLIIGCSIPTKDLRYSGENKSET